MGTTLNIIKGNTVPIAVWFEGVDLTGGKVYFTCKKDVKDTDANAVFQKIIVSHSDPTNGKTTFELSATDTDEMEAGKVYRYDCTTILSNGKIYTLAPGKINCVTRITQAMS
jgi:hypothetical protein